MHTYIPFPTGGWAVATWWWSCRSDSLTQSLHQNFVLEFLLIWRFLFKFIPSKNHLHVAGTGCWGDFACEMLRMRSFFKTHLTFFCQCQACDQIAQWHLRLQTGGGAIHVDRLIWLNESEWIKEPTVHESGAAPHYAWQDAKASTIVLFEN